MTRSRIMIAVPIAVATLAFLFAAGPREADWKEVDDAMNKGLPKTAIEKLEPIIAAATREQRYAEAIKAIAMKISLQGTIQGNKPEEKITRMRAAIDQAPAEMKPTMEAVLANWYWQYFQQNRWRFMQRTQTAEPSGEDFTTWDLPRILAEIDQQFQKSLAAEQQLKSIPVAEYDDLLEKGIAPDAYRPTLYDVLAHNALAFYSSGEQVASRAQDAFDLLADSPIFAAADDFITWQPESDDDASLKLKAIKIYQSLLRFHRDDDDRSAFLDADLSRLSFGNNHAFGEEKAARYKAALRRFASAHAEHEISARALHDLATVIHGESDWVKAHKIASEGMNRFPRSVGGRGCFNLIAQIEARSARVAAERVWNDPRPTIDVHYRNVDKIYFRLTSFDFDRFVRSGSRQPQQLDRNQRRGLLAQRPVLSWSVDLPKTDDYQERVEQIPAPDDVPAGSYYLIASHNADFSDRDNQISFTEVWESELAIVTRNHRGQGLIDGFVLDASDGQPIAGAAVRAWQQTRNNRLRPLPTTRTDRNGLFHIKSNDRNHVLIHASHRGQSLSSFNYLTPSVDRDIRGQNEQTILFTDRSLYRPGQTIHYKGICLSVDQNNDNYETIPRREVSVLFTDVNGKLIERLEHRTNDYGSFSGSVTAPRDRLMGRMAIHVPTGPVGRVQVTVEEYKRPKFQVELEAPRQAAKLDGLVELQGQASAYTGAAIDGAQVSWRVVREVRYPDWWAWRCWWMPPQRGAPQEIAHGTTTTGANGSFDVEFTAKPDPEALAESEPTFQYTIYADVTDTTGETRSAQRSIRVGYTALSASLSTQSWLTEDDPVEVAISATTLDGEGQSASGIVKIFAVQQPEQITRPSLSGRTYRLRPDDQPQPDPTNPNSWPLADLALEAAFETDAGGKARIEAKLDAGMYRALLESNDRFGKPVTAVLPIEVLDPDAEQLNLKIPHLFAAPESSLEPGQTYRALWGSGYDAARAFVEVEHRGKTLQSYWTERGRTQAEIEQEVNEAMRGGFTVRTTMVRENRAYLHSERVEVPWSNKRLTLRWEHFVSKLEPAAKETWTAIVSGPDAEAQVAELAAAMYDASLDAYLPHQWLGGFNVFRQDYSRVHSTFENQLNRLQLIHHGWSIPHRDTNWSYRQLSPQIVQNLQQFQFRGRGGGANPLFRSAMSDAPGGEEMMMEMSMDMSAAGAEAPQPVAAAAPGSTPTPDLSKVAARQNLNETAFFFPHLIASQDGEIKLQFTMPEALTEWNFLGFAHDNQLRSGLLTGTTVTAKDLMVQPNPPRFLREGDTVEFTVKVSNQSPTRQSGTARLTLADAGSGDSVDAQLANHDRDKEFSIPAGESISLAWRLSVPDGLGFLTYKAVGSSGRLSDGEEGYLPVLSRRILLTESLPLPIRGEQAKQFEFTKLLESAGSDSLQHQSLTLQMVSNPSWYAVLALPYLMEYPHECSEQVFNRLYANSLARQIAGSDPKIHRIFEQWRNTPALDSPLEKNQDLKAAMIEETPWYRQAQSESQARRNVGILFDDNRLNEESSRAMRSLSEMQRDDGAWPWFPGGPANDYITLYITTGFGRMRHLGVDIDPAAAIKSLRRLDDWVARQYERIKPDDRQRNHLSPTIALYLYGRSFFLQDQAVAAEHREAVAYWTSQAKKHWLDLANRQSQGHLAVALKRLGEIDSAKEIMASIKERSVSDPELGMFWRDTELSWWWYRAPIETQAMMIEAFDEVLDDQQAVEDCKVWLLKQKQTQDWKTTKATADAVYALLLRGSDLLASDALVDVSLGGVAIEPDNVEAGTGYYEQRFSAAEIRPELAQVRVRKTDPGVAWGSLHWQYLEDISKVTPYEGTPLKLTKELYVKKNTPQGPTLKSVDGPLEVGDELVVRVVLRTDRDMEYVHLKDHRGSGTEPVNVLSRYKFQDGLAYYQSTRDTASHFFIDYLPKGAYVFEYSTRVQLRGEYQTGVASIQCMYAPEFNSHSESLPIVVK